MVRVRAVLQARTNSRRLPAKVLADLGGRPMILRQLERLRRATRLEDLLVATSTDPGDDELAGLLRDAGTRVHRGSLEDVLDRFVGAIGEAEHVVRLTADCPLADPEVIDVVVERHLESGADYTSNTLERTFPIGLDVEVATAEALRVAAAEASLPSEREHVTPFLYKHPERFRLTSVRQAEDLSRRRWTVDEQADLDFVRAVYAELSPAGEWFSTRAVLELLARRPELEALNAHIEPHQGYRRSLEQDPS